MGMIDVLLQLCPCDLNPETTDGPQRECPVHGDGVTFVADVRRLRRIEAAAHEVSGRPESHKHWTALRAALGVLAILLVLAPLDPFDTTIYADATPAQAAQLCADKRAQYPPGTVRSCHVEPAHNGYIGPNTRRLPGTGVSA